MISFDGFVLRPDAPIYLQILLFVKRGAVAGTIADGDELPSRRMLSALLGVNPNTIQKAYQDMESRGIIYSVAGRGNFVSSPAAAGSLKRQECMAQLEKLLTDALHAGISASELHEAVERAFTPEKEEQTR